MNEYYNDFISDTKHWTPDRMAAFARSEMMRAAWDRYCAAVDRQASHNEIERLYALFMAAERGQVTGHAWYSPTSPSQSDILQCARCGREIHQSELDAGHRFTIIGGEVVDLDAARDVCAADDDEIPF